MSLYRCEVMSDNPLQGDHLMHNPLPYVPSVIISCVHTHYFYNL